MYVLANCDLGHTEEIASELREINQVQEFHLGELFLILSFERVLPILSD